MGSFKCFSTILLKLALFLVINAKPKKKNLRISAYDVDYTSSVLRIISPTQSYGYESVA